MCQPQWCDGCLFLLVLQQHIKPGERPVCGGRPFFFGRRFTECLFIKVLLVLVVVAVEAKELPVAAVGRVVLVVVVLMVDREFPQLFPLECTATPGAHMGEKLEGLLSVALLTQLPFSAGLCDELLLLAIVILFHGDSQSSFRDIMLAILLCSWRISRILPRDVKQNFTSISATRHAETASRWKQNALPYGRK